MRTVTVLISLLLLAGCGDDGFTLSSDADSSPDSDADAGEVDYGSLPDAPLDDAELDDVPLGDVPPGDAPVGDAPDGDAPLGDVPPGDAPDGDAPDGDAPLGDVPPGDAPDGDVPLDDVPPDSPLPLERLDWRTTRGSPIATTTVTLPTAELFAISGGGFLTRSECDDSAVCTFTWHDLDGAPGLEREQMTPVTITSVSPDGAAALLVAVDTVESCIQGESAFPVADGTLQLLDLATGEARFELDLRSNFWTAPAFTPLGDWLFAAPIAGTACLPISTGVRSATSPFGPPPGLLATDELVQAVGARRWLVFRGSNLGLADPLTPGSFLVLGDEPSRFEVTQGWVHVYLGFGNLAQDVVSVPPAGPTQETTLRDEDWFPFGSVGRWIRVCSFRQVEGYRECRVVDALAEVEAVNFQATDAPDHPDDAVLLGSGAVVFVGPTEGGDRAVQRITLATGHRELLHAGQGRLRSLGDGSAALLLQDGNAWLIEAAREELVAEQVRHVGSVPQLPVLQRVPGRQDDVAVLVASPGDDRFTAALLDVRTRRLATLTDDLYFTPPVGFPFAFDDGCGQPWTLSKGGSIVDGLFQEPRDLFFVEAGTPATLWILPIDLSAPPRRLAELAGDPVLCHAPSSSPDGLRLGFAEDVLDQDTTVITLSSEE